MTDTLAQQLTNTNRVTWQQLDRHRRQLDPTIPTVNWLCDHHPPNAPTFIGVRSHLRRVGACMDCHAPINVESRRCSSCARAQNGIARSFR